MEAPVVGTIAKEDRQEWVARLLARGDVIAPTAAAGGDVLFARVSTPGEVVWEFENPLPPPKAFLMPQTEPIACIRRQEGRHTVTAPPEPPAGVLLNVRSCDVKGTAFLRRMFAEEPADGAWLRRADRLALVSLACTRPCRMGFCVCCDAGPFLREGFDVQLVDLGDRLLAEAGSPRGRELLAAAGTLLRPAKRPDLDRRRELEEEAQRGFGAETCHFGSAMRRVSTGRVDDALWEEVGDWCAECGACSFLCPACYCFSVADRREEEGFVRCRLWDSCQFAAYSLEASGHNPRARRAERVKRRFFHKVSAQYYRRDGDLGCVGCGRCVKACLGEADMPVVVTAIRKGSFRG